MTGPSDSSRPIRPVVVGLFRDRGRILVFEARDAVTGTLYHRPLGGGIEFGESSVEALRREIREELGAEIVAPVRLGVLENRFVCDGRPGQEVVFVYDARFADEALYDGDRLDGVESDGEAFGAVWRELGSSGPEAPPLYPDGLLELIRNSPPPGEPC